MSQHNPMRYLAALALSAAACTTESPIADLKGDCADAFGGQVCTWAKTQGKNVVEVGALVPIASIANAPAGSPESKMEFPPVALAKLDLPEPARQSSGLTQLTMYWEAMGHPPGPYLTPHFDFHFYYSTPATDVAALDCADSAKPSALPAGYSLPDQPLPPELAKMAGVSTLIGLCVPHMGMHSLLTSELESKETFRGSMVIGYYHAKPVFVEPMVTRAMLMEKRSFDLPIPDIPGLSGAHPTKFHAEYDKQREAYRFVFSGFSPAA